MKNNRKNKSKNNSLIYFWLKKLSIITILIILFYKYYSKQNLIICVHKGSYNKYFIKLSDIRNKNIVLREKEKILKYISLCNKREITHIHNIFSSNKCYFGNKLILLNKLIFYCEILRCKKIILNKNDYWFIKKNIQIKKYKISIERNDEHYYNNSNTIIDKINFFFWFFKYIYPQYRTEIIKKEILRNLPKIKIIPNDIYIYIRSGDIFKRSKLYYLQPPLCFYKCILSKFRFKTIYIIAENSNNPVINKLLIKYTNIIFNKNSLKLDISYLLYAFNIVGAYSTFLKNIVLLNDNIKLFWLFEFPVSLIFSFFFSYEFNHKEVSVYTMKANNYYKLIKKSKTFQNQINIMLNFKCKKHFRLLTYNK